MPIRKQPEYDFGIPPLVKMVFILLAVVLVIAVIFAIGKSFYTVIPAGHVGVMETLGKVSPNVYDSGLVFPKNPFQDPDQPGSSGSSILSGQTKGHELGSLNRATPSCVSLKNPATGSNPQCCPDGESSCCSAGRVIGQVTTE